MAKTPLSTLYNHIKTLIKQFTYLKSEIDTALSLKIDTPGTGLSKNGTTLNHSNSITAQNSNVFKKFKYDGQGHITGTANVSASDLPSNIPTSKISGLSAVATSNDYGDLDNKPSIPSKTSDLTNDSGYLTQHQDISGKEDKTNKTSSWNSTTNNTRYPTEKLVKDSLDGKSDNGHTHSQYLTSHQDISGKSDINHGHGNITKDGVITGQASKNVVTDSNGKITTENKYVHPSNHPTSIIKEASALANIGTSADANQHEVNDAINTALNGKANTSHSHDDRYYTESEIDTKLNGKANTNHTHDYSKVSVNPTKTSGVEIGRITVDGTEKILYQQDNNTTYSADESTLTKSSGNQFSVKDKGITNAKIADGTIESGKIKDANVTTAKIADSAVTSAKIADGTIVNADIASNAAIDFSKINLQNVSGNIDFNNYKTQGYYSIWWTDQQNNTNKPTTNGGLLEVKQIPNGYEQTFYCYGSNSNIIFYRTYYSPSNVWNNWIRIDGQDKANISHTHPDTQINWNGSVVAGSVSPLDMAAYNEFNANRLAGLSGNNITVEWSKDGGSTWTSYGTEEQKRNLVTTEQSFTLGNGDKTDRSKNRLRITIDAGGADGNSLVYMVTRKILIFLSTQGASGTTCQVSTATYANPDTFTNVGNNYTVSGYSGWNSIPFNYTFGHFNTSQSGHIRKIRFTFAQTGGSGNMWVSKIRLLGENQWLVQSQLAKDGHIYTYDSNQNVTFPAKIIKSGGTTSQFLKADGSVDSNTYLTTGTASSTYLTKTDANTTYQPKGSYLTSHNPIDTALSSTSTNAVQNKVVNSALSGKAPTSHASTATTYGVATTANYGHTKVVQNLTTDDGDGLALGAGQGKALKTEIDGKSTVSVSPTKTSGVEIGRITVDGTEKILYQQDNNTTYTPAAATPTADTSSGAVGTSAKYAREDHVHPKSSLYAEASHTHSYAASNHNHSGTYVDGAGTKNTIDGSAIAEIKANTTVKGTIYHPKVNSSALTGVPTADATIAFGGNFSVSQPSVNTDGHVTGLTSRKITLPSLGTTATTACAGNDSRLSNSRVPVFTKIPATSSNEVSLNTYKTGGFYYIDSDSNAKYIDKCPTAKASNTSFFLLVETWGTSSNYIKQTLTYYNTNKTYVRTKAGNSNADTNWKDWVEISKDTDTTYSAEKGITLSSGKFGHSNTAITAQSTSGLYKITYDAYGHITGATAVDKADITGLGIPGSDTNTTYSADNSTLQLSSNQFSVKDKGITNAKIADGTIESGKIKDGTIVNADIASNAAIAYSKLSGVAASSHTHSKSNISDWGKWQRVGSWGTSSGWNQTVYCNGMFVYVIIKTGTYSINSTTWVNAGSLQADAAYRPPNIFYVGSNNDVVVKLNPDGTIQLASYSGTKSTYGAGNFIYPYDLSNNLE